MKQREKITYMAQERQCLSGLSCQYGEGDVPGGVPSLPSIVSAAVAAISVVARHVIWDVVVVMARTVVMVVAADTF